MRNSQEFRAATSKVAIIPHKVTAKMARKFASLQVPANSPFNGLRGHPRDNVRGSGAGEFERSRGGLQEVGAPACGIDRRGAPSPDAPE